MSAHDDWDALLEATHEPLSPEELAAVDRIVAAVRRSQRVRSAAWDRLGEYGDADLCEWTCELLHTDDADIAADYDGLVYAAEWLAMHAMPEPTDLGDDR